MNGPARRFQAAYATTLEAYLRQPDEAGLRRAYDLGRWAVEMGLNVLELASVHHETMRSALERGGDAGAADRLIDAAGDVFLETLSAYEMLTRGYAEAREAAMVERRQTAAVRRLSSFLADASLAIDDQDVLHEALQLVAEQARELVGAARCDICLAPPAGDGCDRLTVSAAAGGKPLPGRDSVPDVLTSELTALDGHRLGTIAVVFHGRRFTTAERALIDQLAHLTSAALERSRLYRVPGGR